MNKDTLKLTDRQVLHQARKSLEAHMSLRAEGYKCSTTDLWNVLLGVAVSRDTLEAICADWEDTLDPETFRQYLKEHLHPESLSDVQAGINAALAAETPERVWRHARDIAIDLHDRPYYGKTSQEEGLWVRGRAKAGTTRFYQVATAYVMLNNLRVTLALHFFRPGDTMVTVFKALLERLDALPIRVRRLFLDKGFASVAVMKYVTRRQLSAIIACPIRGKTGGTRALCSGHSSYATTHTFNNAQDSFTAQVAVCRTFTSAKRTGRLQRRATWLLYILIRLELAPRQVRRLYRRRFGIKTSYRCAGKVRG